MVTCPPPPPTAADKIAYSRLLARSLALVWPSHHVGLQLRVLAALGLIVISRLSNMFIPQLYKAAVDALSVQPGSSLVGKRSVSWYVCTYVVLKAFVGLQNDVKNLVFTPVSQYIKHTVQLGVFDHLHSLSHKYHLRRKTGTILQVRGGRSGVGELFAPADCAFIWGQLVVLGSCARSSAQV